MCAAIPLFMCAGIPSLCRQVNIGKVNYQRVEKSPKRDSWKGGPSILEIFVIIPRSELACMLLPKVQAFQELILKIEACDPGRRFCRDDATAQTGHYLIEWRRRRRHSDPFIISPRCVGVILFLPPLEIRRRYKQEQFKGFAATPLFSNFPNVQSGPSGNSIKIGICKYSHDNLGKRVSRSASRRTSCQPTIDGLISGRRRETDEKGFP